MKRLLTASVATLALLSLVLVPTAAAQPNFEVFGTFGSVQPGSTVTIEGLGAPGAPVSWNITTFTTGTSSGTCPDIDGDGFWSCDIDLPPVNQEAQGVAITFESLDALAVPVWEDTYVPLEGHFFGLCAGEFEVGEPGLQTCTPGGQGGVGEPLYITGSEWPVDGTTRPLRGQGNPGADITVFVNQLDASDPAYCTTVADGDGNWSCPDLVVPPLAPGAMSEVWGVRVVQELPNWLPRQLGHVAVQSRFALTSPWYPHPSPEGTFAIQGIGTIGTTVTVGTTGETFCEVSPDVAGIWSCDVPVFFGDLLAMENYPVPYYGLDVVGTAKVSRLYAPSVSPSPDDPVAPDNPDVDGSDVELEVPCFGRTGLIFIVFDGEGEEVLFDAPLCECPAPGTYRDGLTPDGLVGAVMLTLDARSDPAEREALRSAVEEVMADSGLTGWRAQMELIVGLGYVVGGEALEALVADAADSAWRDGLDPFEYTPDWWKLAAGDTSVCGTPVPPDDTPLHTPPPEIIRFTG